MNRSARKIFEIIHYFFLKKGFIKQLMLSVGAIFIIYIMLFSPNIFFSSQEYRILDSVSTYNEITLFFSSLIFLIALLFWRYKYFLLFHFLAIFLIIRFGEIYHYKLFGFGYEPITLANINIESVIIFINSFKIEITIILIFYFIISFFLLKIKSKFKLISLIVAIFLVARGGYFISNWLESDTSEKVYAFSSEFSLARAFNNYTLQRVILNEKELNLLSKLYKETEQSGKLENQKNIFLIYLESFSFNYLNEEITPELYKISRKSIVFSNFFNSVTPTINAIVASQCGIFPNLGFEGVKLSKYSRVYCLGDYLKEENYYLSYLQAADKNFANKIDFYTDHHFDRFIGGEEIKQTYSHISSQENIDFWGVNDRQLFEIAKLEVQKIQNNSPFLFSLININTHTPGYFSKKCPVMEEQREIKAIKCTDYFLGKFYEFIEAEFPESLFVVVGDHVAGPNNAARKITKDEYINSSFDRTILIINDLEKNYYKEINIYGTTVDLFPTLVEFLGGTLKEIHFGKSLFSKRNHYQNLITPEFHLSKNYIDFPKHNSFPSCFTESNNFSLTETNNCTRKRIFTYFDQNLLF